MMADNSLMLLGASSEVGCKIIEQVYDKYDYIYAHYSHSSQELEKLKTKIGEKLILIKEDFSISSGERIIDEITKRDIWPNHIIHLSSPRVENLRFTKTSWDVFEENITISLKSIVNVLRIVLGKLVKQKREGKVIIMLTSYTCNIPPKFLSPYITTKYALLGLMKALSAEYDSKNIMVNGISPGMMETRFLDNIYSHSIEENAAKSPFGRNLYVDEVIPTIEFLLSDGANRITGQNIVVSGGM